MHTSPPLPWRKLLTRDYWQIKGRGIRAGVLGLDYESAGNL